MSKSFLFVGGDKRQLYALKKLTNLGIDPDIFGFFEKDNFSYTKKYDVFVLPAPFSKDNENIFAPYSESPIPFSALLKFPEPKLIIGGNFNDSILNLFKSAEFFDLLKVDSYNILNGSLTAEGAVCTALLNTPFTIMGANVLVSGFGKIGKPLSLKLLNLGANVYVSARKKTDLSYIKSFGLIPICYENLEDEIKNFDIIFNTVPSLIFNDKKIMALKKRCVYIELASSPGGIDKETLKKSNLKYISALSLPGKYSPESSGDILSEIILSKVGEI